MTHRFGWKRQQPDQRDFKFATPHAVAATLPPAVDLFGKVTWVDDQGDLGSCGPNSMDTILRYDRLKQGLKAVATSRLFTYYETRVLMGDTADDTGVDNRTMLSSLNKTGYCDETLWPYAVAKFAVRPPAKAKTAAAKNKIKSYAAVRQTLDDCRGCLATGFPFLFGFTVYDSFESAAASKTGTIPMPKKSEGVLGGHDVVIYGYDDATQRFNFQNSWGQGWGNKGRGTIPYAYVTDPNLSGDFWAVNAVPGV